MKVDWNFSHRWDLVVAGEAWNTPVCCTPERGGFVFMSKDVEWKLRQERGDLGVEAERCAVEVEKKEHEGRLKFQPSEGSCHCRGSLEAAGVLCSGTRFFLLMTKVVEWKLIQVYGVRC